MHEPFRRRVAPPFLYVLSVLDRIQSTGGREPAVSVIRPRIRRLLGQFDVRGPDAESYRLARTALVYWVDEVLINSTWDGATEWRNNPLERELLGTRSRAWQFFENADLARGLDSNDALEVFALCVANGFQGVYRSAGFNMNPTLCSSPGAPAAAAAAAADGVPAGSVGAMAVQGTTVAGRSSLPNPAAFPAASVLSQPAEQNPQAADLREQPLRHDTGSGDGFALAPSLEEWAAAAFGQLLEEGLEPCHLTRPCDAARTARPATGAAVLKLWSIVAGGVAAVSIVVYLTCLAQGV